MSEKKSVSVKKAVLLNAAAKYTTVILQLVYTAILSRMLTPEEYGTVAIINVFIVFFQLIADLGLGTGVIQNKDLDEEDICNIFSFSIYLGIILFLLFICFSFPIANIYRDKIYIPLGLILSFSLAFNAFNMIPNAILLREKKFFIIALRTVAVAIISFSLTIFLAIRGAGVYALVANSLISAVGIFLWNEISTKLRFRCKPKISSIRKIWGYSVYQFGAQTLSYFNRNLDNLLIGRFFSKESLGYYNKAYTLMQYPIGYLPGVITPVLHPILSEYQNKKEFIYEKYMRLLKILSLIGCFGSIFCFFASREIILIAFGTQWEMAIVPFKLLSLSLWPQILTNTIAPIYQSLGYTKLMFRNLLITTVLTISCIIGGIFAGNIASVSAFVAVAYIINFFITFYILIHIGFNTKFLKFVHAFRHEFIIFIVMIISSLKFPFSFENIFLNLFFKFIVTFVFYVAMIVIMKEHKVFMYLKNNFLGKH